MSGKCVYCTVLYSSIEIGIKDVILCFDWRFKERKPFERHSAVIKYPMHSHEIYSNNTIMLYFSYKIQNIKIIINYELILFEFEKMKYIRTEIS
jgi:hypothetical protein